MSLVKFGDHIIDCFFIILECDYSKIYKLLPFVVNERISKTSQHTFYKLNIFDKRIKFNIILIIIFRRLD